MEKPQADTRESADFDGSVDVKDVFGNEEGHQIHYKTVGWKLVSVLMITEVVSSGLLAMPSSLGVVGIFPGLFLIIFLGLFAIYTAKALVDFKLNHPEIHSIGDAGMILFGPMGREVLSFGAIVFSIFGTGSVIITGQQALSALSDNGLCAVHLALIFSAAAFLLSLPRTLGRLTWLSVASTLSILISGIVGMIGSGRNPVPGRVLHAVVPQNYFQAFLAVTNPMFGYAGHFMFLPFMSEMKRPQDAMKSVWVLQTFAISLYSLFGLVCYVYVGDTIQSPSYLSLPPLWRKVAFAIALPNFLVGGGIYIHVPAKMLFVRLFRHSKHLHSHTFLSWFTWVALCFLCITLSFLFAVAVPIFNFLIGICAALFASWYTYGIAGFFWLHDARYLRSGWRAQPVMAALSVSIILAGAFMCVAGTHVFIKLIVDAYASGSVPKPFTC